MIEVFGNGATPYGDLSDDDVVARVGGRSHALYT